MPNGNRQKKAEIEARKYELIKLQLFLANDESSMDKVCESIPEKMER
jgi:hypothetical protein